MRQILARTPVETGNWIAAVGVALWLGFVLGWIAAKVDYAAVMKSLTF